MVFLKEWRPLVDEKFYRIEDERGELGSLSSSPPTNSHTRLSIINKSSFKKKDRLRSRSEFLRVQKRGRKLCTKSLVIMALGNKKENNRLGIAVSRKFGKSVARNKMKRTIREIFRNARHLFPPRTDLVLVPKIVFHHVDFNVLLEEIKVLFRRK